MTITAFFSAGETALMRGSDLNKATELYAGQARVKPRSAGAPSLLLPRPPTPGQHCFLLSFKAQQANPGGQGLEELHGLGKALHGSGLSAPHPNRDTRGSGDRPRCGAGDPAKPWGQGLCRHCCLGWHLPHSLCSLPTQGAGSGLLPATASPSAPHPESGLGWKAQVWLL